MVRPSLLIESIQSLHRILEHEHNNDEKKLLSLLQESQEERDELLSQQVMETFH